MIKTDVGMKKYKKVRLGFVIVATCVMMHVNAMRLLHQASAYVSMLIPGGVQDNASPDVLRAAIRAGDEVGVRACLDAGADCRGTGDTRITPLCLAAKGDSVTIVSLLLAHSADVNEPTKGDCLGMTPLCVAVERCNASREIVQCLIDAGAVLTYARFQRDDGKVCVCNSPLTIAVGCSDLAIVELLLQKKADAHEGHPYSTPLHEAARKGRADIISLLVGYEVEIDAEDRLHGETPLMGAAKEGHSVAVDALIMGKADVNRWHEGQFKAQALHKAMDSRHSSYVSHHNRGKTTESMFKKNRESIISLLIDAKASCEEPDYQRSTAFQRAANRGDVAVVQIFIRAGAPYAHMFAEPKGPSAAAEAADDNDSSGDAARSTVKKALERYAEELVCAAGFSREILMVQDQQLPLPRPLMVIVCDYAIGEPEEPILKKYFDEQMGNMYGPSALDRFVDDGERLVQRAKVRVEEMVQGARGRVDDVMRSWRNSSVINDEIK